MQTDSSDLKRTPLHSLHVKLGARMGPFAGYDMPIQYPAGVLKEHVHTRTQAGLFDVSHMGQLILRPRSGKLEDAALALERLVPVDILGLGQGRQRYALFTNASGGILDDLMVANRGNHLFVVVNAGCKEADEAHLRKSISDACEIERLDDRALIALQGPAAQAVLAKLSPDVAAMRFMDVRDVKLGGADCIVSRSGYTGEDGYEISVPVAQAETLAQTLLADPSVAPIGLGARDSLRLEAGLCLYGSDLDPNTTPIEAALEWAMQKARKKDGARAGGFPGADIILKQLSEGAPRRRVGLRPEDRTPVRGHSPLFADAQSKTPIGEVTSGGFGPTAQTPVAMGYVDTAHAKSGTPVFAEVRGKRVAMRVHDLPFVPHNYKR